jgi:hypothetical protein
VRDVGEQRPERDDELDPEHLGQLDDRAGEGTPAVGRLVPDQQDEVARGARDPRFEDLDLGPGDLAVTAVDEPDLRARVLEVEELLGIDRGEAGRADGGADEADGRGGGVGGVVPALEGAHQRRRAKTVRSAVPDEGLHANQGTPSRPAARRGA